MERCAAGASHAPIPAPPRVERVRLALPPDARGLRAAPAAPYRP
jgi:hypothetical protein